MAQLLSDIVKYCNERLDIGAFEDYENAFNGLQFQNSGSVSKVAAAVDASSEAIEKAVQRGADLLVVHHGLFWGKTIPVTHLIYEKYKQLMDHDLAIYSCHLPLDAHPEIGNNALLAQLLGLTEIEKAFELHNGKIGVIGNCSMERGAFKLFLESTFPRVIAMEFGPENIGKIGIVSGGSGMIIERASELDVSTVLIGECQQYHYNIARENHMNTYVCGHYATEIFGVKALGQEIAQKFSLPFEFIPTECPL
ncbi:MAG: Nif3-like dinuclear metal center hexameric protein [Puniceicoccales bacterium]|jgi:dinuclear metal center YbgI/SA1388 family protein|nr:Nif3-like dinuclear metal center hexameric protein [Puniceicoccales bacterium]